MHASAPKEILNRLKTMIPIGKIAKPEEIAGAVIWLCSDTAPFVTGIGLAVDGGISTV